MRRRLARHARHNAVGYIALFFALTGTGAAASRYLITSTRQIKPSVLRNLRAATAAEKVAAKGTHAIVAHLQSAGPVTTMTHEFVPIPLSSATWTQHAGEVDELVGHVTVTNPTPYCGQNFPEVVVRLGGTLGMNLSGEGIEGQTEDEALSWTLAPQTGSYYDLVLPLYAPAKITTHTLTAEVYEDCVYPSSHFTVDSVSVDVLGFR